MNCPYCKIQLSDRGYYCHACTQQVRCKECSEILEPNSKACVICGTKLSDDIDIYRSEEQSTSKTRNIFELHETGKSRIIRAEFTDNVGSSFAETLALFAGHRINPNLQGPNTPDRSNILEFPNPKTPLQNKEISRDNHLNLEDVQSADYKSINTDKEQIEKIFRFDEDRVSLKEPRLKAESKLDYGKRIIYLFIYANELRGVSRVSRKDINAILKEASVFDGNIRTWIARNPDLSENDGTYELRNSGQVKSKEILAEIFDADKPDGWMPGKTAKSRGSRKVDKNSSEKSSTSKKSEKRTRSKGSNSNAIDMVKQLINEEFFKTPKTLSDVLQHCIEKKVQNYRSQTMATALSRCVKDKTINLDRHKNSDKQYEYYTA